MKQAILLSALFISAALGAASRGAVTEGFFIIQNKHRDAKEEIQELKKELTSCCVSAKGQSSELDVYHCKLRQLLYPGYIDELSRVIKQADKEVLSFKKDNIEQGVLDKAVSKAILLIDKIALERKYLSAVFEVDRTLKQLSILKKKQDPREKEQVKISQLTTLQEALKKEKKEVAALKLRIKEVNGSLFNGTMTQSVFLDKLAYYIP